MPDLPPRPAPSEPLTRDPSAGLTDDRTAGLTDSGPSSAGPAGERLLDLAHGTEPAAVPGYELLDEVGRGGMGVVYRARDVALGRDVAVKLLQDRFPADGPAARRFAEEARITGQLQHPGIPPVHQVGTTADGRPFLAMKLIKGETLDALIQASGRRQPAVPAAAPEQPADAGRSPQPTSLNLLAAFEALSQAVGYAHAHGVVHRDLKPANVMVGTYGEVQVMDWGLAKVLADRPAAGPGGDPALTAGTEITPAREAGDATQAGSLLGTPAYMAPEQAIGAVDQIDARTDVFGLGGILCALLTGRPPFVGDTAESTRQLAARARLGYAFGRLDGCAADPELVALCKRCLAAEKADRPADGGEVARAVADLRAAADDRARQAELDRVRADGDRATAEAAARGERRRRRAVLAGAAAVVLVFAAGAGGSLWQADRADRARADAETEAANARKAEGEAETRAAAERAAREEADRQRAEADRQRATATAVKNFFRDILGQADADGQLARGDAADPNLTVKAALDRAAGRIEGRFADQPLVEAEVRDAIGTAYFRLGENIAAEAHQRRAADLYTRHLGAGSRAAVDARLALGDVLSNRRKYRAAGEAFEAARAAAERAFGPDDRLALSARYSLALLRLATDKDRRAADEQVEGVIRDYRLTAGPQHPDTLNALTSFGGQLAEQRRRLDRAEELLAEAVAGWRAVKGDAHPLTLYALERLADVRVQAGRLAEAEPLLVEALAGLRRVVGESNPYTLRALGTLVDLYNEQNLLEEVEPLLARAVAGQRAAGRGSDPLALMGVMRLGVVRLGLGRYEEAEPVLRELLAAMDGLGVGHRNFGYFEMRMRLGEALLGQGRWAEAEAELVPAWEGMVATAGAPGLPPSLVRPSREWAVRCLAAMYTQTRRPDQARKWLNRLPPGVGPWVPVAPRPREVKR